ncbi:unnamed protein product [Diabrotica balteata]|uniref:HEAT repeat-containing protein 6 n=1 Tax=Diabrotica balteata TaxID=107213 RepID=A0A9N9T4P3_DIABA|nr:unnamed protein product [Diabrotica balteata]
MAANVDSSEIFNKLSSKITNLLHGRTEGDRSILSKTLDDLNSLNYRYTVVTNPTKAVLLVNQCCSFVSTDDEVLVPKCSQLLWNLVNRQNVPIEGRTLTVAINWCLNSFKIRNKNVILDILQALDALLRTNVDYVVQLLDKVSFEVIKIIKDTEQGWSPEIILISLQCLEACTAVPTEKSNIQHSHLEICAEIFLSYLCKQQIVQDPIHVKMLQVSLYGLQNIIIQHPEYLKNELGLILGVVKSFMVLGIKGIEYMLPQKLLPSILSIPEATNVPREKKGGKLTKQRKHRSTKPKKEKKDSTEEILFDGKTTGYSPATTALEYNSDSGINLSNAGNKFKTSDSDFSDSESGRSAKLVQVQGKVRHAAFNLFYNVVKNTEKYTMFSYWSSFIPEGTVSAPHNLLNCILKDPSSRCRMSALNVLLVLLTSSKLYLAQAENSIKSTSFTPFSVVLGLTIRELHKGLSLALVETSVPVLIQLLKCLGALVQATPYHKMSQGLITKIVRNVKPFIYHKDASVQVTALIVLGCVVASEPIIPETKEILLKKNLNIEGNTYVTDSNPEENGKNDAESIVYAEFSDDEDEYVEDESVPWLLKRCLSNLGVQFTPTECASNAREHNSLVVPVPVKLESLQVISAVTRNYFEILIAPYLSYITKGLHTSLSDKYADLRLHAGRAIDFIGQAISRYLTNREIKDTVPFESFLTFWQNLLSGPLIDLLQCEDQAVLKAVGCDCLGSIGSDIFEKLPRDKQIVCVTLLFSCTRDEEKNVKAAAVRALAICVMYSSLREDPGFVVDTAEAIYRTLQDQNLMVRIKASWSLGNLSDALMLNNKTDEGIEEIPRELIIKLIQIGVSSSSDNDKVKMNAVRALGNLIQIVNKSFLNDLKCCQIIDEAFDALVKSCITGSNMKVRWNACYAIGNALKNSALYQETTRLNKSWQDSIYKALTELVVSFKNFKVRINAALSLSCPTNREHYGNYFVLVWTALLEALENSQQMEDFSEYKHRDHLVEQVCLSLGHLTTLLRKGDLGILQDVLDQHFDVFRTHTQKVLERLVPEKSTTLTTATITLNALSKDAGLNNKEMQVLEQLTSVFVPII